MLFTATVRFFASGGAFDFPAAPFPTAAALLLLLLLLFPQVSRNHVEGQQFIVVMPLSGGKPRQRGASVKEAEQEEGEEEEEPEEEGRRRKEGISRNQ